MNQNKGKYQNINNCTKGRTKPQEILWLKFQTLNSLVEYCKVCGQIAKLHLYRYMIIM